MRRTKRKTPPLQKAVSAFLALLMAVCMIPPSIGKAVADDGSQDGEAAVAQVASDGSQDGEAAAARNADGGETDGHVPGAPAAPWASHDEEPAVSIEGNVTAGTNSLSFVLAGSIPEGAMVLVKSYPADTSEFVTQKGTWVCSLFDVSAGTVAGTPQEGSLEAGRHVVAFVLSEGKVVAQSDPVTVKEGAAFSVTLQSVLTPESKAAHFLVEALDPALGSANINIVALCKVEAGGAANSESPIARVFGKTPGSVRFDDLPEGSLSAGDQVCLVLTYENGSKTFQSDPFTVSPASAEDSIVIQESQFTTESVSASVTVTGYEEMESGLLILTTGPASESDADSRTQIASTRFTGAGTYEFTFSASRLKAGNTILPHLYLYDAGTDKTSYRYGEPVSIVSAGGQAVEPSVEIATESITADRTDLWVIANFDASLTGKLALYLCDGDEPDGGSLAVYEGAVSPSENSQRISFGNDKLAAGKNLVAVLELSNGARTQSAAKTIQAAPEKERPVARITDTAITEGDTHITASLSFDESADEATWVLYQFTGETLDPQTASVLASGTLYRSTQAQRIYVRDKLVAGSKLQLVLTAEDAEGSSNVIEVGASPDWGQPYLAFAVAAVQADAESITVTVDYADEYLSMGEDFYCDVSVYQFPASYSDDEFEDSELWENTSLVQRVGQVNSLYGDQTRGTIEIPVRSGATLEAGSRLAIKLRLPHTEWEGEEVDYVSASVPVLASGQTLPDYRVVLYNLSDDTSRGNRVRTILDELGIPCETMEPGRLNETVGHLAGFDGYEAAGESYSGEAPNTEFMLMCNLPEALLDQFLDAMMSNGLRIDHKAIVTEYNRDYTFYELIADIGDEHEVFQALLALGDLTERAEELEEAGFGASPEWGSFRTALDTANAVLASYEPTLEALTSAYDALERSYLALTGAIKMTGTVRIAASLDEDGTYTLQALVDGTPNGINLTYTWSSGEESDVVWGVPARELAGRTVTISGEGTLGTLKAQLRVPDAPVMSVEPQANALTVSWNEAQEQDNCPMPTTYRASVYHEGSLVQTVECESDQQSLLIDGLSANTAYTVKLAAISPVGRSDLAISTTQTKSIVTPGPGEEVGGKDAATTIVDLTQQSGGDSAQAGQMPNAGKLAKTGDPTSALASFAVLAALVSAVAAANALRRHILRPKGTR